MKLIDIEKKILVPIRDETLGDNIYEIEISLEELLSETIPNWKPDIVNAVPVSWLNDNLKVKKEWRSIVASKL